MSCFCLLYTREHLAQCLLRKQTKCGVTHSRILDIANFKFLPVPSGSDSHTFVANVLNWVMGGTESEQEGRDLRTWKCHMASAYIFDMGHHF
jgi:hypothetical protein